MMYTSFYAAPKERCMICNRCITFWIDNQSHQQNVGLRVKWRPLVCALPPTYSFLLNNSLQLHLKVTQDKMLKMNIQFIFYVQTGQSHKINFRFLKNWSVFTYFFVISTIHHWVMLDSRWILTLPPMRDLYFCFGCTSSSVINISY